MPRLKGGREPTLHVLVALSSEATLRQVMDRLEEDFGATLTVSIATTVETSVKILMDQTVDIACVGRRLADSSGAEAIALGGAVADKTAFVALVEDAEEEPDWYLEAGAVDCLCLSRLDAESFKRVLLFAQNRRNFDERQRRLLPVGVDSASEAASAKHRLEATLAQVRASERYLRTLIDLSPVGMWQMSPTGSTISTNHAARELLGLAPNDDGKGMDFLSTIAPGDVDHAAAALKQWAEGLKFDTEFSTIARRGGGIRHLVVSGIGIPSDEARVGSILVTVVDLTNRKQVEVAIQHLTHHDALTHLPNRTLFLERLPKSIVDTAQGCGHLGILLLDVDRFKRINEALGHQAGDLLLKEVARRLRVYAHKGDVVCRLGGDEFGILCPNQTSEKIARLARRLSEVLALPYALGSVEIRAGVSIGIALYPSDSHDPTKLVSFANMALYAAKEKGANEIHFFDKKMDEDARNRRLLEEEIARAIDQDQFVLYFQPQVDLATKRLISVEALIRWVHPTRGIVYPGEFIPVAEQCGLIVALGQWVIRAAIHQAQQWRETNIRVAINLSAVQFHQNGLIEFVQGLLTEFNVNPEQIEFEITEGVVMENTDFAISVMHQLSNIGIALSIDDFGTGFSSLAYLKKFPVKSLKIDRSFVTDVLEDSDNAVIASSIISLAHSLELQVVAEGVETEAQADWLAANKCDVAQGYLFGRPLPAAEMEEAFGLRTR